VDHRGNPSSVTMRHLYRHARNLLTALTVPDAVVQVEPHLYLGAAAESMFLTLAISWLISLGYQWDYIRNNSILSMNGYNNVCVGWDNPPARHIAASLYPFVIFFQCRFTATIAIFYARRFKTRPLSVAAAQLFNICYVAALAVSSNIFVVRPADCATCVRPHTLFFIGVPSMFLPVNVLYYATNHLSRWQRVFLAYFIAASIGFVACLAINVANFDPNVVGPKNTVPPGLTAFFDFSWFALLGLNSSFLPHASDLLIHLHVEEHEEPSRAEPKQAPVGVGAWRYRIVCG
tara:strand:- start:2513 stop:3382 length:870 start_codon:yes stop_codon:yes gene_type:complete